jgi:hypothetical protein
MIAALVGRWRWLPAVVLLVAAGGCGQSRATVSGKVTYNDKPVSYGSVTLLGPDDKAASGAINPDGTYTVEGLTPGEARIGVISRDPAKGRSPRKDDAEAQAAAKAGWVPLPRQYEAAASSGLTATLKPGHNTYDIDLK